MLLGAFVRIGRQLISRPYSQLICAGSLPLNCGGFFIHLESLASSWRTPSTLLCLLFRVVGALVAWEQV